MTFIDRALRFLRLSSSPKRPSSGDHEPGSGPSGTISSRPSSSRRGFSPPWTRLGLFAPGRSDENEVASWDVPADVSRRCQGDPPRMRIGAAEHRLREIVRVRNRLKLELIEYGFVGSPAAKLLEGSTSALDVSSMRTELLKLFFAAFAAYYSAQWLSKAVFRSDGSKFVLMVVLLLLLYVMYGKLVGALKLAWFRYASGRNSRGLSGTKDFGRALRAYAVVGFLAVLLLVIDVSVAFTFGGALDSPSALPPGLSQKPTITEDTKNRLPETGDGFPGAVTTFFVKQPGKAASVLISLVVGGFLVWSTISDAEKAAGEKDYVVRKLGRVVGSEDGADEVHEVRRRLKKARLYRSELRKDLRNLKRLERTPRRYLKNAARRTPQ